MESAPFTPDQHGLPGTNGKDRRRGQPSANKPPAAGPRSTNAAPAKERAAREDWLALATADPAFWVKGADR